MIVVVVNRGLITARLNEGAMSGINKPRVSSHVG